MIILAIIFHLLLIVKAGFFLSPELTLYPFLTHNGFLPYKEIIDQHFPVILFGPISLPAVLTTNPLPLLALFLLIIALTDYFFYYGLIRFKSAHRQLPLIAFVSVSFYFQVNFFWLETFICFFLSLIIFFSKSDHDFSKLTLGFLLALTILVKPTIIPGIIFLLFFLRPKINRHFIVGLLLPPLIIALYLIKLDIYREFYQLAFEFNRQHYLFGGLQYPNARQLIEVIIFSTPFVFLTFKKAKTLLLASLFFSFLAYPRFEPFHLLPCFFLLTFSLSTVKLSNIRLKFFTLLLLLLILLNTIKLIRHNYGNFYLNEQTITVSQYVKNLSGNSVYVFAGNDLIYPLSGKIPPSYFYLPSLPWYLEVPEYQQELILALSQSPQTPLLVNKKVKIDNIEIVRNDNYLIKFIKENYLQLDTVGEYDVYVSKILNQ